MSAAVRDLTVTLAPIVQRLEQFFLNRAPRETIISQCEALVLIRWRGVMSEAERRMLHADAGSNSRQAIETLYRAMVQQATAALVEALEATASVAVQAVFYDLDTVADEALLTMAVQ